MNQKKHTLIIILATVLLLLYVHVQSEIYKVSYSLEDKEKNLAKLSEDYKSIQFRVSQLRSPLYLSNELERNSIKLVPPKSMEVIRIPISEPTAGPAVSPSPFERATLLSWFGTINEAQAETSK